MSVMEVTKTEKATGLTIRILSELFDEESGARSVCGCGMEPFGRTRRLVR